MFFEHFVSIEKINGLYENGEIIKGIDAWVEVFYTTKQKDYYHKSLNFSTKIAVEPKKGSFVMDIFAF